LVCAIDHALFGRGGGALKVGVAGMLPGERFDLVERGFERSQVG
jgi:hypothetical protein